MQGLVGYTAILLYYYLTKSGRRIAVKSGGTEGEAAHTAGR
jgi:hypothetical protein